MKCDLNCPPIFGKKPVFCCLNCSKKFHKYMTGRNLWEYWDEKDGFWSPDGCRLPRKKVPKLCKDYNCKEWRIYAGIEWNGEKWVLGTVLLRPLNMCNKEHAQKLIKAIIC